MPSPNKETRITSATKAESEQKSSGRTMTAAAPAGPKPSEKKSGVAGAFPQHETSRQVSHPLNNRMCPVPRRKKRLRGEEVSDFASSSGREIQDETEQSREVVASRAHPTSNPLPNLDRQVVAHQESLPLDGTEDFHRAFVEAVYEIGMSQSSPRVLRQEMLLVTPALTNDRIKSHLQKYRKHTNEHKDTFMKDYNEYMAQLAKENGGIPHFPADTTRSRTPGGMAAHLSHLVMNGGNSRATTTDPSFHFLGRQLIQGDLLDFFSDKPIAVVPNLTPEEERSSLGRSISYTMQLFQEMKQHIVEARAPTARMGPRNGIQSRSACGSTTPNGCHCHHPEGRATHGNSENNENNAMMLLSSSSSSQLVSAPGRGRSTASTIVPKELTCQNRHEPPERIAGRIDSGSSLARLLRAGENGRLDTTEVVVDSVVAQDPDGCGDTTSTDISEDDPITTSHPSIQQLASLSAARLEAEFASSAPAAAGTSTTASTTKAAAVAWVAAATQPAINTKRAPPTFVSRARTTHNAPAKKNLTQRATMNAARKDPPSSAMPSSRKLK